MAIKAVFWDFGGVLTTGPFDGFAQYEREHGLPPGFLRRVNATNPDRNAWAQFERDELDVPGFGAAFKEESAALGHAVDGRDVLPLLAGEVRPEMVEALKACRARAICLCITNNAHYGLGPGMTDNPVAAGAAAEVMALFHHVVESREVGARKPEPRIYNIACEIAGVAPEEVVYLDDLGINLKPTRAMGMTTIKVTDPDAALAALEAALGFSLV